MMLETKKQFIHNEIFYPFISFILIKNLNDKFQKCS